MSEGIPKTKRAPSQWNLFFQKGRKAGQTAAEVAADWKVSPENPKNKVSLKAVPVSRGKVAVASE